MHTQTVVKHFALDSSAHKQKGTMSPVWTQSSYIHLSPLLFQIDFLGNLLKLEEDLGDEPWFYDTVVTFSSKGDTMNF